MYYISLFLVVEVGLNVKICSHVRNNNEITMKYYFENLDRT